MGSTWESIKVTGSVVPSFRSYMPRGIERRQRDSEKSVDINGSHCFVREHEVPGEERWKGSW